MIDLLQAVYGYRRVRQRTSNLGPVMKLTSKYKNDKNKPALGAATVDPGEGGLGQIGDDLDADQKKVFTVTWPKPMRENLATAAEREQATTEVWANRRSRQLNRSIEHRRLWAAITSAGLGQSITHYTSKWRNIRIRDMCFTPSTFCAGGPDRNTSRLQYKRRLNHSLFI